MTTKREWEKLYRDCGFTEVGIDMAMGYNTILVPLVDELILQFVKTAKNRKDMENAPHDAMGFMRQVIGAITCRPEQLMVCRKKANKLK